MQPVWDTIAPSENQVKISTTHVCINIIIIFRIPSNLYNVQSQHKAIQWSAHISYIHKSALFYSIYCVQWTQITLSIRAHKSNAYSQNREAIRRIQAHYIVFQSGQKESFSNFPLPAEYENVYAELHCCENKIMLRLQNGCNVWRGHWLSARCTRRGQEICC